MIKANNITNLQVVKMVLDIIKPINKYIDTLEEDDVEYELLCEKIEEQFCEIEKSLIGKEKFTEENRVKAMMRMEVYWDYLKSDIDFDELLECLKEYSDKLLLQ